MARPTKISSDQSNYSSAAFAKAAFEKIMVNSEEVGKLKLEPFNVATVERCRALYRENEKLFASMVDILSGEKK